ncbi:hypothetical protein [Azospirillum halopraeferens]|uniref:hypothetical protein n=1 Tax=Azospirillum halopraeferens TaxID=34010 RepID=UPI000423F475|nr:hypothetical protein [Azospirillum halopraeferens]
MSGHGEGRLYRVKGLGGHIDVYEDRVEIHRGGMLQFFLELFRIYDGDTETVIARDKITAVTLVEPWFWPGYVRFSYDGAAERWPHYWQDAMTPNALLMGYIDNRGFHRLKRLLDAEHRRVVPSAGA